MSYAVVDVFFGLSIIEILGCIALFVFFIKHRNHLEIKKCAPIITLCMLAGVLGLTVSELILSFGLSDAFCTMNLYIFRVSVVTLLTCLIAKNYRIYKIFSNKKATAIYITESRLLLYIGCFLLFWIIFLTIFVAIWGYDAVLKQSSKNEYYQWIECAIPNDTVNNIFKYFLEFALVILIIISLILAYITRRVKAEYSESRALMAVSIVLAALMIIFIPLAYSLTDESDTALLQYIVKVELLTISIGAALGILFIPKVYSVLKHKQRRRRSAPR